LTLIDEHIAAYMFHPLYKSVNLTAKQLDTASEWITIKDPSFIALLINYQAQASPFPSTFSTNVATKLSPINWWKACRYNGVPIDFLELAVKLLSRPASSARSGQIFTNFGNIRTKVHNETWLKLLSKDGMA